MKLLNEDYLDNVPDMSGPSPFKSDGTRKDDWFLVRIPAEKVGQKDRWLRKTIDFWETPRQHYKSSYNYYAIQLEDGEVTYVKAPAAMDKHKLLEKIEMFLKDEFGYDGMWEIKGFINKKVAQDKSEWRPA